MKQISRANLITKALALHQSGDYQNAAKIYQQCIKSDPHNGNLHQLFGVLKMQIGEYDEAETLLLSAAKKLPKFPPVFNNISVLYKKSGRINDAIKFVKEAINLDNDYYDAHLNLANLYFNEKNFKDAEAHYTKCLSLNNKTSTLYNNRGICFTEMGKHNLAIKDFEQAIDLDKNYAEPLNNKANTLLKINKPKEAINYYKSALLIDPENQEYLLNLVTGLINANEIQEAECFVHKINEKNSLAKKFVTLGMLESKKENFELAAEYLNKSLKIDHTCPQANKNLGLIEISRKNYSEAEKYMLKELEISKESDDIYFNLGNICSLQRKYKEAIEYFEKAFEINPSKAEYPNNIGSAYYVMGAYEISLDYLEKSLKINENFTNAIINKAQCYERLKKYDLAIIEYNRAEKIGADYKGLVSNIFHANRYICNWENYDAQLVELKRELNSGGSCTPFTALSNYDDLELQNNAARDWVKNKLSMKEIPGNLQFSNGKIKLGYFSPDFRNHPVSFLIAGVLEAHDRDKFEVYAFSFGPITNDPYYLRIVNAVDKFIEVHELSDMQIAKLSRDLNIDIAIDLAGYTLGCRTEIFAYRAAPVQVSYLGYLGSMQLPTMDYLIADEVLITNETRNFYSENIIFLPSYQSNDSSRRISNRQFSKAELGTEEAKFVYACFNNSYKITPEVFSTWMRILARTNNTVLILYEENEWQVKNLYKEAEKYGISKDRLTFSGKVPVEDYLRRMQYADLFLDTHPYNAGTTCSDALWAGLPVLTFKGQSFASRMAASIINSMNLKELIVNDLHEYENMAVNLASNINLMEFIRNKISDENNRINLFNAKKFTINLENAFQEIKINFNSKLEKADIFIKQDK